MDIFVPKGSIIWMAITAVVLFFIPIIFFIVWKMKNKKNVKIIPLVIGAVGFIISARVLEMILHVFCILLDNPVSRFINGNTVAYVLYGIFAAGIFEECGRYIIMKYIMKKNKTRENIVMYGIGHGGVEVWMISLLTLITYLTMALIINAQGMTSAMATMGVVDESAESFQTTLQSIMNFGGGMCALTIYERLICMGIHISLSIVVFYGIKEGSRKYLILAVLSHAVFDIFPALQQRAVVPMYASEIWITICFVAIGILAKKLYKFSEMKVIPYDE